MMARLHDVSTASPRFYVFVALRVSRTTVAQKLFENWIDNLDGTTKGITPTRWRRRERQSDGQSLQAAVRLHLRLRLGIRRSHDPSLAGTAIKAVHIDELRTALGAVYIQRGRAIPAYSDPAITANVTKVKGLHVSELRMAVRLVE